MSKQAQTQVQPTSKPSFIPVSSGLLQRKCDCGKSAGLRGKCGECESKGLTLQRKLSNQGEQEAPPVMHDLLRSSSVIQPKLKIGQPNDKYEQEADRVADQIMRMPEPSVQRQENDEEEEELLQTKPLIQRKVTDNSGGSEVPPIVNEVLRSPGQPLDHGTRDFMESRFNYDFDFGRVRVHKDVQAAESALKVNALAYTVQKDIVFGQGQYDPSTLRGKNLLAHELTHVLQQQGTNLQEQETKKRSKTIAFRQDQKITSPNRISRSPLLQRELIPEGDTVENSVANTETEVVELVNDDDILGVQDGDSPAGSTEDVGEVSENELAFGETSLLDEETENVEAGFLANTSTNPTKKTPKKKRSVKRKKASVSIVRIDIDLSKQKMTLRFSDGKSTTHTISSGKGCPFTKDDPCPTGDEPYCTPEGNFNPRKKGDGNYKNRNGDAMSWYVEFVTGRAIGIHNTQYADGNPRSHGCVRTGKGKEADALAKKINKMVSNTTTISVNGKAPTKSWKTRSGDIEKARKSYHLCKEIWKKEASATESKTYTVKGGDSIRGIAQKFGVDEKDLADFNGIKDKNKITIGQVLKIPNTKSQ